MVDLYVDLLTSLAFRGAYDQLFKLAQKAMKVGPITVADLVYVMVHVYTAVMSTPSLPVQLPPSLRYGTVVYLAVDALLNLKKDAQVGVSGSHAHPASFPSHPSAF